MEQGKKYCCLILADSGLNTGPQLMFDGDIDILKAENLEAAVFTARNKFIDCIILQTNQKPDSVCRFYTELTAQFPSIPVLVIIDRGQIELACRLGQFGAKHVVAETETDKIETLLKQIVNERHLRGGGAFFSRRV